ncbi:hypothetical protein CRUP_008710 [Coryphaenoides rupestris]|nr:hypothetical protein CRUP_008710 [Coryphaenoides rupestris]
MASGPLLLVSAVVFACAALCCDAKFPREAAGERAGRAGRAGPESAGSRRWSAPGHRHRPQQAAEPLAWRFPEDPAPEAPVRPRVFQLRRPPTADTVAVRCGEDLVDVEVKRDFLGNGRLVQAGELTLGGCPATPAEDSSQVLTFSARLHGCNSKLIMTEDTLIYTFTLVYKPMSLRAVNRRANIIVRSVDAEGLKVQDRCLADEGWKQQQQQQQQQSGSV